MLHHFGGKESGKRTRPDLAGWQFKSGGKVMNEYVKLQDPQHPLHR
jgi:hypothetical protein